MESDDDKSSGSEDEDVLENIKKYFPLKGTCHVKVYLLTYDAHSE